MFRRHSYWAVAGVGLALLVFVRSGAGADEAARLPVVTGVDVQPLAAQIDRLVEALEMAGAPLDEAQRAALEEAFESETDDDAVRVVQEVLDRMCLMGVHINPEGRVKVEVGPATPELVEDGWRLFLVKVHNEAHVTAPLRVSSPNAAPLHDVKNDPEPPATISARDVRDRWLDISQFEGPPLNERLSGLALEYRVLELHSRDRGPREAKLRVEAGQGSQDLGFRSEVNMLFTCRPAVELTLEVLDADGAPTTGQFTFRDERGRIHPARSRRLAPDFFFHDQVYRNHGEKIHLPAGKYEVTYTRGPEYLVSKRTIEIPEATSHTERFRLQRWINLAEIGWFSGDHHVHAAGCSHYSSPTQGVGPADMMRHIVGEDLNVGCVLTWGPCWYHQKQFFDGGTHGLSLPSHLMRYDVEVSGFPSSHAGHLVLLRLREDDYPGTRRIEDWPSWTLPVLRWAKDQGGVVGFAHSGWGLAVPAQSLPTFDMPPFDGIGANEYIVDVTHGVCDFISTVDTPAIWELNIWYHTLNCGYTTRISGETDFPCIYDERVGLGRSYVKLGEGEPLDFDHWVDGLRAGRSYVCDGLTHLFDFTASGLGVGEAGKEGRESTLAVRSGERVAIKCKAASLLAESPGPDGITGRKLDEQPYWHTERARIAGTREVAVELIVNGEAVDKQILRADGSVSEIEFSFMPERSSWIALRVFPAAHTNPIFVEVDGKPIRASRRSAEWCLRAVDECWKQKAPQIRESELADAAKAYDHARAAYREILAAAHDDLPRQGGEAREGN